MAIVDINIPIENAVTDGSLNPVTSNAVFDALAALPSTSGFVPYTGATTNVDLGTHKLTAKDLVVNHPSGSGVAASITKGGSGEALTVVKSSGSGNAASITGGVTLIDELHLTTDLADTYIASAATWNAKQAALVSGTNIKTVNSTSLLGSGNITVIPTHDGATYDTNAIQTLTAAEYAAITPNASTLYFIV
jgi:hemin uptake protein HemP